MEACDTDRAVVCVERMDDASEMTRAGSSTSSSRWVALAMAGTPGLRMEIPSVPKTLFAVFRRWGAFKVGAPGMGSDCEEEGVDMLFPASETVRLRPLPLPHHVPIHSPNAGRSERDFLLAREPFILDLSSAWDDSDGSSRVGGRILLSGRLFDRGTSSVIASPRDSARLCNGNNGQMKCKPMPC
jgi:hypothetical protein